VLKETVLVGGDAVQMTKLIREKVPQIAGIEMRFYDAKGHLAA
jgi:hypothetical protein